MNYYIIFVLKKNALSVEEMFDSQKFVFLINDILADENQTLGEFVRTFNQSEYFATLLENLVSQFIKFQNHE